MSDTSPLTPTRFDRLRSDDPQRIGPYILDGRIGSGGMGAVYAGHQPGVPGHAAVKTVREELAGNAEFRARFARETELAKRASGMCIPRFFDADPEAELPWLATEYIPGPTLRTYIRHRGPLTGDRLTALGVGLADALARVHAQGVVHRDLKPGNIILGPDAPKLVDFGIARAVDQTALTRTGGAVGTAGWMSPEAYAGGDVTGRSDVFSWGALLAFAATGREPFGTGAMDALAYRVMQGEADLEGVPDPLLPLVRAALSKDPQGRPDAAGLVSALVERWSGSAPAAPAAGVQALLSGAWTGMDFPVPAPAPRPRRARRGMMIGVAVVAALALAGGAAVAAPSALEALSAAGSGEQPDGDGGDATGGADDGSTGTGDGEGGGAEESTGSGDGRAGDGAPEDGDTPSGPPPEAIDQSTDRGMQARAEVRSADGSIAMFSAGTVASLYANVYGIENTGDGVRISVNGQSMGVRQQVPSFDQSNFYVIADGRRFDPAEEFVYTPELDHPMEEEPNENALVFNGAPEKGLLVFRTPEISGTQPGPVGLCYSAAAQSTYFTTDYAQCT